MKITYDTPDLYWREAEFDVIDDENDFGEPVTTYVVLAITGGDEDGNPVDIKITAEEEAWAIEAAEEQAEKPIPASVMRRAVAAGVDL